MTLVTTTIIGTFFLLTAGLKAFHSKLFIIHVKRFKLLPEALSAMLAILFIELEAALGLALILQIYLHELLPVVVGILVFFTLLGLWGHKFKNLKDCGCYGGLIRIPLALSTIMNLVMIGAVSALLTYSELPSENNPQNLYFVIAIILVFHLVSKKTIHRPLFDILKLKPGKSWPLEFYPINEANTNRHNLVFLLVEANCSLCKSWMKRLSEAINLQLDVDFIVLNAGGSFEKTEDVELAKNGVSFFDINNSKTRFLRGRLPMVVRVEDGVISGIKTGSFPGDDFFLN